MRAPIGYFAVYSSSSSHFTLVECFSQVEYMGLWITPSSPVPLDFGADTVDIRALLHAFELGVVLHGYLEVPRDFLEHDEKHSDLFFRTHIYFGIYLLAYVLRFALAVLGDEYDDREYDCFKRDHHGEKVEGVRVEDPDAGYVSEVDEYPEGEDADVCNEKRHRPEFEREKFRKRSRPGLFYLEARFYLFAYPLLTRAYRLFGIHGLVFHTAIIARGTIPTAVSGYNPVTEVCLGRPITPTEENKNEKAFIRDSFHASPRRA